MAEPSTDPQTTAASRRSFGRTQQGEPAYRAPLAIAMFIGVTVGVLVADMALKYWAFDNVAGVPVVDVHQAGIDGRAFWEQYPHEPQGLVPGVLSLKLTTNPGAVFGLGKGNRWFFVVVSVLAIGLISYLFLRSPARSTLLHLALALILAGALGNLYDRWFYGVVRDMLWLFPGTGLWPWIFNLADVSLVIGVGLIILLTLFHELRRSADETVPG